MKKITLSILGFCALFAGFFVALAQDTPQAMHPPKVLIIMREYLKPGKSGPTHEKTESLFVQAFEKAKWPTHYIGMESLSGKSRALFFTGYDSFDALDKDNAAIAKNASLSAGVSHASAVDGELLDEVDQGIFIFREDLSLRVDSGTTLAHTRYVDIGVFHAKPGMGDEFEKTLKMGAAAIQKSNPDAHWAAYQGSYGSPDGTYIFITLRKSLSEVDADFTHDKDFMTAMGEEGMKKLDEMWARSVESSESQLFSINPHMSYVREDMIKADPDFWKPKMAMPAAAPKKEGEKPSGN